MPAYFEAASFAGSMSGPLSADVTCFGLSIDPTGRVDCASAAVDRVDEMTTASAIVLMVGLTRPLRWQRLVTATRRTVALTSVSAGTTPARRCLAARNIRGPSRNIA